MRSRWTSMRRKWRVLRKLSRNWSNSCTNWNSTTRIAKMTGMRSGSVVCSSRNLFTVTLRLCRTRMAAMVSEVIIHTRASEESAAMCGAGDRGAPWARRAMGGWARSMPTAVSGNPEVQVVSGKTTGKYETKLVQELKTKTIVHGAHKTFKKLIEFNFWTILSANLST